MTRESESCKCLEFQICFNIFLDTLTQTIFLILGLKVVTILQEEMITDGMIDVTIIMIEVAEEVMAIEDIMTEATIIAAMMIEEVVEVMVTIMIEEEAMEIGVDSGIEVVTEIDRQDEILMEDQNDESKELNSALFVEI